MLARHGSALITVILTLTTLISGTEAAGRRTCLLDFQILGVGKGVLCQEDGRLVVIDTACQAFEPIRYSRKDTPETQRQARAHNAAYDALCKDE